MRPYSQDLRERVVNDIETGECSQTEAADKYAVSLSFVQKLMRRVRETGSCAAKAHTGGVRRKLAVAEQVIRAAVKAQPDITLNELCAQVKTHQGLSADDSMMSRELKRLGLTLKKSPARQRT